MIKLVDKFWIVGTSTYKYFDNYISNINSFDLMSEIYIENDHYIKCEGEILNYKSEATTRQNLICWEALGFIKKINKNKYVKIVKPLAIDEMVEYSKFMLLVPSSDEQVERYRHRILHILVANLNIDLIKNNKLYTNRSTKEIDIDFLKKETSKYEEILMQDKKFMELVKKIGEYCHG